MSRWSGRLFLRLGTQGIDEVILVKSLVAISNMVFRILRWLFRHLVRERLRLRWSHWLTLVRLERIKLLIERLWTIGGEVLHLLCEHFVTKAQFAFLDLDGLFTFRLPHKVK